MDSVFPHPFVTRIYPSLRTGQEITVRVAEVPLTDYPDHFVIDHFEALWNQGRHLLPTDMRGTRAWSVAEVLQHANSRNSEIREHPWQEVWEIFTVDQIVVLDLVMFTEFYSERTMDRFGEFAGLVLPLIKHHSARFRKAHQHGVLLETSHLDAKAWKEVSETTLEFNAKYFKVERPRKETLRAWRSGNELWFGPC